MTLPAEWKQYLRRKKRAWFAKSAPRHVDDLTDEQFIDLVYTKWLGRDPDPEGRASHLQYLKAGNSRASLLLNFAESPEFAFRIVRDHIHDYIRVLPIMEERPDRYRVERDRSGGEQRRVFVVRDESDFDWLERKIVENGYYERPGVWSFFIDEDKRLMAEIAAEFKPRSVLDVGCANGAVLKCLKDLGIPAEGVEISRLAVDMAPEDVRGAIHIGDLRTLRLPRRYDLVLGLDIYEHFNPNRLDEYIARIYDLVEDGGFVFANIPAFGPDQVFGEIFKIDLPAWDEDVAAGRCFRVLPVDDYGYPRNGHLIGAATGWWVDRFERAGFRREPGIERTLHQKHDRTIERISPARKSFYVFSR